MNSLVASNYLLMPILAEFLSLKGAKSFRHLKLIRNLNGELSLLGFVLTRYDRRKTMTRDVETQLHRHYGADRVFKTHIRSSIALTKAQDAGIDIFSFDKSSNGAADYSLLAQEFLSKTGEL